MDFETQHALNKGFIEETANIDLEADVENERFELKVHFTKTHLNKYQTCDP